MGHDSHDIPGWLLSNTLPHSNLQLVKGEESFSPAINSNFILKISKKTEFIFNKSYYSNNLIEVNPFCKIKNTALNTLTW